MLMQSELRVLAFSSLPKWIVPSVFNITGSVRCAEMLKEFCSVLGDDIVVSMSTDAFTNRVVLNICKGTDALGNSKLLKQLNVSLFDFDDSALVISGDKLTVMRIAVLEELGFKSMPEPDKVVSIKRNEDNLVNFTKKLVTMAENDEFNHLAICAWKDGVKELMTGYFNCCQEDKMKASTHFMYEAIHDGIRANHVDWHEEG